MKLCDDGHDEVFYEGKFCPICAMIQERDIALKDVERLNSDIDALGTEILDLHGDIDYLERHQREDDRL